MFVEYIVIHCSDTPNYKNFRASDIDAWHRKNGWDGIGYHYVVCVDGCVETGRSEKTPGAHVKGLNHRSIGICLIGRSHYTQDQWGALEGLVLGLKSKYPEAKVVGHNQFSTKKCPGFFVPDWWESVTNID